MGSYYRGRSGSQRSALTPPAELVGQVVTWSVRDAQGRRSTGRIRGRVVGFDAAARALSVEISQQVSMWQPNPTRTVTIPLAHGPFAVGS